MMNIGHSKNGISPIRQGKRLSLAQYSTYVERLRPYSKWKPNILYNLYHTGFPLGNGSLPDFVKNTHVIIS